PPPGAGDARERYGCGGGGCRRPAGFGRARPLTVTQGQTSLPLPPCVRSSRAITAPGCVKDAFLPARGVRAAAQRVGGVDLPSSPSLPTFTCNRTHTFHTREVYTSCMKVRTNIEIEDLYVQTIMNRYGVRTKTEAVELALRHLAGQPMSRDEALAMRGAHAIEAVLEDAAWRGAACFLPTPRPGSKSSEPLAALWIRG